MDFSTSPRSGGLDGAILDGVDIPVADTKLSREALSRQGFSVDDVDRHHAVWEIFIACLVSERDKILRHNFKSPSALYRAFCKLYSAETQGGKLAIYRRAFGVRVEHDKDPSIAVSKIDS